MKRFGSAALSFLVATSLATITSVAGPAATASAERPGPGTTYGATGTGTILGLDATLVPLVGNGLTLANAKLASSSAVTSSTASPRSSARSANLAAAVVGLPLTINTSGQTAPPDNPTALGEGIPTADINLLSLLRVDLGVLQATNHARWTGDTSCVPGGLLSESETSTADAAVDLGLLISSIGVLSLGAANVHNTNSLVNTGSNTGTNKAVRSQAVGTLTDLRLLDNSVVVTVTGNPTLTATATGATGTSSVTNNADDVVVSVKVGTAAPVVLTASTPLNILGLGTLRLNAPSAATITGTTASGSWDFLSLDVNVLGVTSVDLSLLSLTASATAPTGGLDCGPPAVNILKPAAGATLTDRSPVISGDGAEPGNTVTVKEGSKVLCTTKATSTGTWSCTSAELAEGSHTISVTQTDAAGITSPVTTRTFRISISLVITSPPLINRTMFNTPLIAGRSDDIGSSVRVFKTGTTWCTTTVKANKTWSCRPTNKQPDGFHLVNATTTTAGGFTKTADSPVLVVIDTLAPGAPRLTSPSPNSVVPVGTLNLRGTGAPGGTLSVRDERGTVRGTVFVSLNGLWTIPVRGLSAGTHSFTATQFDGAKNVSAASAPLTVRVSGTNGVAGVRTPVIDPTLDKRSFDTASLRISGQGQRGSKIVVTDERGVKSAAVTVGSNGAWAVTFPSSPQGNHRYTAIQTYTTSAGRTVTVPSQVAQVRLDTANPGTPTLIAPATGESQVTRFPAFGGSAEAGVLVQAFIDGKRIIPAGGGLDGALTDNDRRWIFKSTVSVLPGAHTLRLVSVDPAGNRSGIIERTITTR